VPSFADVEALALAWPETTSTPSYAGAPALRVGRKMFARLRGEMTDQLDELTGGAYGAVLMVGVASTRSVSCSWTRGGATPPSAR